MNERICADEALLNRLTSQSSDELSSKRNQNIMKLERQEAQIDYFFSSDESAMAEETGNPNSPLDTSERYGKIDGVSYFMKAEYWRTYEF